MSSVALTFMQLGLIGLVILILFGTTMFFGMFWYDVRSKYNDVYVRRQCASKLLPMIRLLDLSGLESYIIGDKDKKYDLKFKGKERNILVDPAYLSKMPHDRLHDGVKVYTFTTLFHFPIDKVGVSGVITMFRNIRTEYPELMNVRDDFVILELMGKNSEDLPIECAKVITRYDINDEVFTPEDFAATIEKIKSQLKGWGIEQGYMSVNQAVSRLPFGTMARDISAIEEVTDEIHDNEWGKQNSMIMTYGMAAMFVLIGAGIAVYIINLAMSGGT